MGQLRIDNVTASSELEAIRLMAESLFPAGWIVEMVGSSMTKPSAMALRVLDENAREVGKGVFTPSNHLKDVTLFLNGLAVAVVDDRGAAAPEPSVAPAQLSLV